MRPAHPLAVEGEYHAGVLVLVPRRRHLVSGRARGVEGRDSEDFSPLSRRSGWSVLSCADRHCTRADHPPATHQEKKKIKSRRLLVDTVTGRRATERNRREGTVRTSPKHRITHSESHTQECRKPRRGPDPSKILPSPSDTKRQASDAMALPPGPCGSSVGGGESDGTDTSSRISMITTNPPTNKKKI